MTDNILPYFSSLKSALADLASGRGTAFGTKTQADITTRLLDCMYVRETDAKRLQANCFAALLRLLPEAELLLKTPGEHTSARGPENLSDSLRELQAICETQNFSAFDRFLHLCSKLQGSLMLYSTPAASTLRRAIIDIDRRYCAEFEAAVDVRFEASKKKDAAPSSSIRNTRQYDEKALLAFIRSAFPKEGDVEIRSSGFISGGTSKFTMLITLNNARSLPAEIVLRGDATGMFGGAPVSYEYRLIKAVYENGGCVPKPLAVESSGSVFGAPFMLLEKRSGVSIGHMQNLPRTPNPPLCADIAAKLAALHLIPVSTFGTWINGADVSSSAWALRWIEEGYRNWATCEMPSTVFSTAFDWLRRHAPINDRAPRTLVHGDYGLNNLLVEGSAVTAILDWEFSHLGNPAYDLGYFRCMAEPLSSWEHFLAAYESAGGPLPDKSQLDYATIFASTRLGVMTTQVTRAFLSGAETGLVGAMVVGGNFYEMMVNRIGDALDRVL
ncbi:MAG: phosphotransferase family protein [Vicinamibacterales bacterium]